MGTTTVLTLTLTGITADLASGGALKLARRGVRLVWMFLGAFLGAAFILHGTTLYAVIAVCCFYAATTVAALYSEQHASGAAAARPAPRPSRSRERGRAFLLLPST